MNKKTQQSFETESLLHSKEDQQKTSRRWPLKTLALMAITVFVCYQVGFGEASGAKFAAKNIPEWKDYPHMDISVTLAEYTVFKAHWISRIMGADSESKFFNIPVVFKHYLNKFKGEITSDNVEIANNVNGYVEIKKKVAAGDVDARKFWGRVTAFADFKDGKMLYSEDGHSNKKVSGSQLKYWSRIEKGVNFFSSPKWLDNQGMIMKTSLKHHIMEEPVTNYSPQDFWKGSWGPAPIKDLEGNEQYTKHHLAAEAFNSETAEQGIAINAEIDDPHLKKDFTGMGSYGGSVYGLGGWEKLNIGQSFLGLFESTRLGNKLTAEDHMFSRVVESMLAHWATSKHVAVKGGAKRRVLLENSADWKNMHDWVFGLKKNEKLEKFAVEYQKTHAGCNNLDACENHWANIAREIWA